MMSSSPNNIVFESDDIPFGSVEWFIYAGFSCLLVLFAGIMSGLTLGLMSLGLVELEILQRSGTITEKKQAGKTPISIFSSVLLVNAVILPVIKKQHQLLVTLLLCNACAMEALPISLDKIFHPFVAVLLSVTFVLVFGEIIPQAICSRYGLSVGANFVWLVRILMIICYPIAYPIGKVLDAVIGHGDALFRRAQLKALVSIHSQEAGKGGELTHDETTIISGALDLTEKTAEEAMTPIESTFSLDVNSKLDWEAVGKILAHGHSRIPVYYGNPKNIIGLLLIKSLLTLRAETETPVSAVSIRRIPRVPAHMPLYDILNEFQKGSSHMAAVVKSYQWEFSTTTPLLTRYDTNSDSVLVNVEKPSRPIIVKKTPQPNGVTTNTLQHFSEDTEDGEVIGIITLEDVFEELLQEEIVDETDVYVDVHKRIRVAAAASSVARAPSTSSRRLIGQKPSVDSRILKAVAIETLGMSMQRQRLFCLRLCLTCLNELWLLVLPHKTRVLECNQMKVAVDEEESNQLRRRKVLLGRRACSSTERFNYFKFHENNNNEAADIETEELILLGNPENRTEIGKYKPSVSLNALGIENSLLYSDLEIKELDLCRNSSLNGTMVGEENAVGLLFPSSSQEQMPEPRRPKSWSLFSKQDSITDMGDIGDDIFNPDVSRSSQTCRIDLLEEIIEDAKNNNVLFALELFVKFWRLFEYENESYKTLCQAPQSIKNLMREVELQEEAAEQAKEYAARGSLDILIKVEKLKQMLPDAKEANDSCALFYDSLKSIKVQPLEFFLQHAGEVYGEKAILATEVRELQSCLLSLSEERDKSLAILDEMRQTLEV
ncbi:hypothetical protein CRYUN_Cryun14cG0098600 [Craigia yunnanensis]